MDQPTNKIKLELQTVRLSKDQLHDVLVRGRRLHRIARWFDVWIYRDGAELIIDIQWTVDTYVAEDPSRP